jgi:hypothetical protein
MPICHQDTSRIRVLNEKDQYEKSYRQTPNRYLQWQLGTADIPTHKIDTRGSERGPPFLREFPALSEQASPLSATEAALKIYKS